jgi:hypothetical protein
MKSINKKYGQNENIFNIRTVVHAVTLAPVNYNFAE